MCKRDELRDSVPFQIKTNCITAYKFKKWFQKYVNTLFSNARTSHNHKQAMGILDLQCQTLYCARNGNA